MKRNCIVRFLRLIHHAVKSGLTAVNVVCLTVDFKIVCFAVQRKFCVLDSISRTADESAEVAGMTGISFHIVIAEQHINARFLLNQRYHCRAIVRYRKFDILIRNGIKKYLFSVFVKTK